MKITRSFQSVKRWQQEETAASGSTRSRRIIRKNDTGEDRIEISSLAKERFEREQEMRKLSDERTELLNKYRINSVSGEIKKYIESLKKQLQEGHYDFDNPERLRGAADNILLQFFNR